jgi:rsbT antagonist protein RsbS
MDVHGHRIPLIKLWGLLLVPLQGEIDDRVADELRREVLDRIHREGCAGLIIDITGLWAVDSHLCALLSKLSIAVAVMGAKTFVAGMKPEIALTLQTMDISLPGVGTTLDLERALELLGVTGPAPARAAAPHRPLEPAEPQPVTMGGSPPYPPARPAALDPSAETAEVQALVHAIREVDALARIGPDDVEATGPAPLADPRTLEPLFAAMARLVRVLRGRRDGGPYR